MGYSRCRSGGPLLEAVDPATQLTIGAVTAVAVGTFVWFLGRAVIRHESRWDVAFAEVLKEGNELVARCSKPSPRVRPQRCFWRR